MAGEVVAVGPPGHPVRPRRPGHGRGGRGGAGHRGRVDEAHALAMPDALGWAEGGGFPEVFATAHDALWRRARAGDRRAGAGHRCGRRRGHRRGAAGGGGRGRGGGLGTRPGEPGGGGRAREPTRDRSRRRWPTTGPTTWCSNWWGAAACAARCRPWRPRAGWSSSAWAAGPGVEINLFALMAPRARVGGATLRARSRTEKADVARGVAAQSCPCWRRAVRVPVCATYPLAEAAPPTSGSPPGPSWARSSSSPDGAMIKRRFLRW